MLKRLVKFYLIFLKITGVTVLMVVAYATVKNCYLSYRYQSLDVPISADIVYQKMGKPNAFDEHPTGNEELWVYEKNLLPSYYVLTVKNKVVIDKYEYISP